MQTKRAKCILDHSLSKYLTQIFVPFYQGNSFNLISDINYNKIKFHLFFIFSLKKISNVVSGQEAPPVQDQDLIQLQENVLDLVGRNQDPAPGPSGVLLAQERDHIQALIHHLPLKEAEREADLDLHPVIAKKGEQDHGHLKEIAGHLLDLLNLDLVQVLKRNSILTQNRNI